MSLNFCDKWWFQMILKYEQNSEIKETWAKSRDDWNFELLIEISQDTSETHDRKTDALSSMGSTSLSQLSLRLTVEKFNGKNFREWAQSIQLVLDSSGKFCYLISVTPKPASTDSLSLQKWTLENSMLTAWLENSMQSISKRRIYSYWQQRTSGMSFERRTPTSWTLSNFELKT